MKVVGYLMKFYAFIVVGVLALGVSGCASVFSPHQFPTGYVYHNEVYKSPPPQAALPSVVTLERKQTAGPEQERQWRDAVYDLLGQLTARAGLPPKPVYLKEADPMTPFYGAFDNNLREAMRHTGYELSVAPESAYAVTYTAKVLRAKEKTGDENVRLTLHIYDSAARGAKLLTEQTQDYYIEGIEVSHFLPNLLGNMQ